MVEAILVCSLLDRRQWKNGRELPADQFKWESEDQWKSPKTGLIYPNTVRITAFHPDFDDIEFVPYLILRNLPVLGQIMLTGKVLVKVLNNESWRTYRESLP